MQSHLIEAVIKGLRLPVIQAPMAGGPSSVDLLASVIQEGLVGSFGFAYSEAHTIESQILAVRSRIAGPINANFFIFEAIEAPDAGELQRASEALSRLSFFTRTLPASVDAISILRESESRASTAPFFPSLEEQLEAVWRLRPELLSFHFGLPPAWVFEKARHFEIPITITATCLAEAQEIEHSGAAAIIAQGIEAGGHQGYFDHRLASPPSTSTSTFELVRDIKARCKLPVIAAGGIMNGSDIRNALSAGACAVQMGTAFLACDESGATREHKHLLTHEPQRGTVLTRAFSGRYARGLRNAFTEAMSDQPVLAFPQQNSLSAALRQESSRQANGEFQSLWAGTGYAQCRAEPVRTLVNRLVLEFQTQS